MENSPEFQLFIYNIIGNSLGFSDPLLNLFSSKECITMFKQAFVHKSMDRKNNYESFEYIGDATLTKFVITMISHKQPDVINTQWVDKMRSYYQGNKFFFRIATENGFHQFILYDELIVKKNNTESKDKRYADVVSDVFEAFFGVIVRIILEKYSDVNTENYGYVMNCAMANSVCCAVFAYLLRNEPMIPQQSIFDSYSRLKEIYDKNGLTESFKTLFVKSKKIVPSGSIIFLSEASFMINNEKIFLASAESRYDEADAMNICSSIAIEKLKREYNITAPDLPDPYKNAK